MPDEVLSLVWSAFERDLGDVLSVLGSEVIPDIANFRMGAANFFPIRSESIMNASRIRYVCAWLIGMCNVSRRWSVVVTGASESVFPVVLLPVQLVEALGTVLPLPHNFAEYGFVLALALFDEGTELLTAGDIYAFGDTLVRDLLA